MTTHTNPHNLMKQSYLVQHWLLFNLHTLHNKAGQTTQESESQFKFKLITAFHLSLNFKDFNGKH